MRRHPVLLLALTTVLAGCSAEQPSEQEITTAMVLEGPASWDDILAEADGQTVDWWLFGGDARINAYIDDLVVPAVATFGVTLRRVPIDDTAEAVQRVAAELAAGRSDDGAVDMIWINGENFAAGVEADLWLSGWATRLPNWGLLDPDDATLTTDFGLPTDGAESPWSRAAFVFAHDTEVVDEPPTSIPALVDWVAANPGRFTYPAPPDFTGSAFVRQVVQALGEEEGFAALADMAPNLWQEGRTHPADEAELNQLLGNGQVDFAMSYNPGFVAGEVERGNFPETVRPFILDEGTLSNVSFVTIPANAADTAGAQVVANVLLRADLQAAKADPDVLGVPTVLWRQRLTSADKSAFDAVDDPRILTSFPRLVPELAVGEVDRLEQRWLAEVLRR